MPHAQHDLIRRQKRALRIGIIQVVGLIVGLTIIALFFVPTTSALIYSLILTLIGLWDGYTSAKSGRLDSVDVPREARRSPLRHLAPILIVIGSVFSALIHREWVGAIAYILFFGAGVLLGINLANAVSDFQKGRV